MVRTDTGLHGRHLNNRMNRHLLVSLAVGGLVAAFFAWSGTRASSGLVGKPAPEFPSLDRGSWSGTPTSLASQRGRPVLINVWTFGCINCTRTLPWVRSVAERYGKRGLTVIGVHSPEFERERDPKAVEAARAKHGLTYPSYIDNGHRYWNALDNHYWPALYLIDAQGVVRDLQVGEVHDGDEADARLTAEIESMLPSAAPAPGR
jgi:thiol-disulfide isomerase/thioredoxin